MAIIVKNNRLLIDGKDVGDVLSSSINYRDRLHEIDAAVKTEQAEKEKEIADAHQAEIQSMVSRHADEVSAVQGQLEQAKAHCEALGGTELAQKLAREKRWKDLQAERERLDAEMKQLGGDGEVVSTVGAAEVKLG